LKGKINRKQSQLEKMIKKLEAIKLTRQTLNLDNETEITTQKVNCKKL
jgi:hypothetical protein